MIYYIVTILFFFLMSNISKKERKKNQVNLSESSFFKREVKQAKILFKFIICDKVKQFMIKVMIGRVGLNLFKRESFLSLSLSLLVNPVNFYNHIKRKQGCVLIISPKTCFLLKKFKLIGTDQLIFVIKI